MTDRLYYTDPLVRAFAASVRSVVADGSRGEVVLDRTAFYPTSGGQPFDIGTLGGARVVDVVDRDDDEIVHVIEGTLPAVGAEVTGEIDWARRFDHMQQHTGQHILSAAFDRLFGVRTVSFHLGADTSTIDLGREVTPVEIGKAEAAASHVVWEDRPVDVTFVTPEEASRLPLRKEPTRTGPLRLVDVTDFDLSACGGTHVPHTGMIGMIAVSAWERFKGGSRITFVCGERALRVFGQSRDVLAEATRKLSVASNDVPATIDRLQADTKRLARLVRGLQEEVAGQRAAGLRENAETVAGVRGVLREERGWDAAALKVLAAAIVSAPGFVAVLVGEGNPAPVVVARSADVVLNAADFMTRATAELGGRGGGRPELAQGGLVGSADQILAFARHALR